MGGITINQSLMANQHIVQRPNGWAILREGAGRDTAVLDTQLEAMAAAAKIADNQGGDVIVHGRDNLFRMRKTYGKPDPFPPKG